MQRTNIFILFVLVIVCAGCDVNISSENAFTATPDFVTATLPPTLTPPATQMSILSPATLSVAGEPAISPIEGITTTQVNIRAEPSTAGGSLGIVPAFSKVQIIGKEGYGKWYQIIYTGPPDGKGWVAVAYVQMDATVEIPIIQTEPGSESSVSGLVIQGINVRSGPGTTYGSFGTLTPNDIVTVTGKDPSGGWMEIEFTNAPDGKGWAASEFLQVNNPEFLPVIGDAVQTVESGAPASIPLTSTPSQLPAKQDGDSMSSPLAVVIFSPTGVRTLQANGDVSAPDGDTEDWLQFTSFTTNILVEVKCSNNALRVELSNNDLDAIKTILTCGIKSAIKIVPNQPYLFRIQANSSNNFEYIQYSLKISAIE